MKSKSIDLGLMDISGFEKHQGKALICALVCQLWSIEEAPSWYGDVCQLKELVIVATPNTPNTMGHCNYEIP
jgi:hypothetical protein